jgi:phosphatidylserine/phosphatidylglycerophosphate/cardiolipin synthase-like enzyme
MALRTVVALLLALLCAACGSSGPSRAGAAPPTPAGGGKVTLWQDAAIFDAVRGLLQGGASGAHLWVEMYEFGRDDLRDLLESAFHAGADVRVVLDPTVGSSRAEGRELGDDGVPVRFYPVDERRHQIDHVKLVVTDGAALVGGMNWGEGSDENHDYALHITDAGEVARLRAIFGQDWSLAGGAPAPLPERAAGPVGQTAPGQEIRHMLLSAITGARHSVDAEVYTLTDGLVVDALADAWRRGVRVRVLVDPNQPANRQAVDDLLGAGVPVRRYPVPKGALLHAKIGLFDGTRLILGSANWTESGLSVNHEIDVTTSDGVAARTFAGRFTRDWAVSS